MDFYYNVRTRKCFFFFFSFCMCILFFYLVGLYSCIFQETKRECVRVYLLFLRGGRIDLEDDNDRVFVCKTLVETFLFFWFLFVCLEEETGRIGCCRVIQKCE